MEIGASRGRQVCCTGLFFTHRIDGDRPLVVLECSRCGRLWHCREDGAFVPYDRVVERISKAACRKPMANDEATK